MTPKESRPYDERGYRKGVGAMLINGQGEVFVAQRIDTREDAWQMPQGGIDDAEDPREAVMRELKEEIGTDKAEIIAESRDWLAYDLPEQIADQIWKGRYRGQKQLWYALRFTGTDSDIDLDTDHPEFDKWRWVPMDRLPALIISFKRPLYEKVVAEFRHLADLQSERDR